MTNSLSLDLACAVVLVLCCILFWVAHLASQARADAEAERQKRAALEAEKMQLTLSQEQVSRAPTDADLSRLLDEGKF